MRKEKAEGLKGSRVQEFKGSRGVEGACFRDLASFASFASSEILEK